MDNSISDLFSTSDIFDTCDIDSDFNHLQVIFEDVLCSVSYIDVESNVFCEQIPKLKELCDVVICKITEHLQNNQNDIIDEIKTLIQRYNSLIKFAINAVKYVKNRVKFNQIQSLPLPICDILLNTFKHWKESDQLYGKHFAAVSQLLTDLFKRANELQSSLLNLMNQFIHFELIDEQQNTLMIKVLEMLSNIGEIITTLDIKSTAELWKGYLILTQTHIEHIKAFIQIEKPIKYFCKQIRESLILLETLTEPELKKIETQLKVASFHLKIVIKLCGLYSDNLGDVFGDLFQLLIMLNRYSPSYLHLRNISPKIIDLMQVYVSVAADPLLGCIFLNREFVQHFLKNINCILMNDDNRLAGTLLIISVMKKILSKANDEQTFMYDILCVVFNMIELLHVEFSIDLNISIPMNTGERNKNGSLYEYLLIHTVSLILISDETYLKLIEKQLFEAVMQSNIWRALFASDVWCILARYGPEDTCCQQLIFLINVFLMIGNVNNKPELYFLKNFINRLFQLLTNKCKNEIVAKYPPEKYANLWICCEPKIDEHLIATNMNLFMNCINPINFNNMIKTVCFIKKPNEKIAQKIKPMWMVNAKLQFNNWQFNYIWNITKATTTQIQHLNNKDLLTILECTIKLSESTERMHLINCAILKSLATKSITATPDESAVFRKISRAFKLSLAHPNPIIKQRALESFTFFAQHTQHEIILSFVVDDDTDLQQALSHYLQKIKCPSTGSQIDYLKNQRCVKFRHECRWGIVGVAGDSEDLEPALKKKKNEGNQVNIEALLARIQHDTDLLNDYFLDKNIPQSSVNQLSCIVGKLRSLLQK